MPGSWRQQDHPNLTNANCEITSQVSPKYNCIAWAAGDDKNAWWPSKRPIGYWPLGARRVVTLEAFIQAYRTRGYQVCDNGELEVGVEKIAIYGTVQSTSGSIVPTHASLQLESGEWTSKMGPLEDIKHKAVHDVNGPVYGEPRQYMSRPRQRQS